MPRVNWLYRPIMYVFCQTEFDCPNVSVNLVLGLSRICPLHGMSSFEVSDSSGSGIHDCLLRCGTAGV